MAENIEFPRQYVVVERMMGDGRPVGGFANLELAKQAADSLSRNIRVGDVYDVLNMTLVYSSSDD